MSVNYLYNNKNKKNIIFFTLLCVFSIFSGIFSFANDSSVYESLAKNGSLGDIEKAFRDDELLGTGRFGQEKESFLMLVLKNKRPVEIIDSILNYECDISLKSKNKATAVMYAAEYLSDAELVEKIITYGTAFNIGTKSRVSAKDKDGRTSFDYASLNENPMIFEVLAKYAPDLAETYRNKMPEQKIEAELNSEESKDEALALPSESEKSDEDFYIALASSGDLKKISEEFKKDEGLATRTFGSNQETFLMLALKSDSSLKIIKKIISLGSDTGALAKNGCTPLMYAARYSSDVKVFDKIMKDGTIFKSKMKKKALQKDLEGRSLYDYARANTCMDIQKRVLEYAPELASLPPIEFSNQDNVEETGLLVEEKQKEVEGDLAEDSTAEEKDADDVPRVSAEVQLSSEKEAKKDTEDTEDIEDIEIKKPVKEASSFVSTYLYDFALEDTVPVTEDKGEDNFKIENPNQADKNGVTLLMQAARSGNDWGVKALLENGADIQKRDNDGWTALMYAVRYQNSLNLVKSLVDNGAYKRVRNNFNATPLLMAAEYNQNPEILALLLKDRSITENEVFNAFILSITSTAGSNHVKEAKIKLFTSMNIPLNRIWKGKTPLMYACQYNSSSAVIKLLLDSGARTDLRNPEGKTAFDYAKDNVNLAHDDVYWSLNN